MKNDTRRNSAGSEISLVSTLHSIDSAGSGETVGGETVNRSQIHSDACSGQVPMLINAFIKQATFSLTNSDSKAPSPADIMLKVRDLVDVKNIHGMTPLHGACFFGRYKTVCFLLEHGADIASIARHSATPLHYAALSGDARTVEALIQAGADHQIKDSHGCTPLQIARLHKRVNVEQFLSNLTQLPTVIVTAAEIDLKIKRSITAQTTDCTSKTRCDAEFLTVRSRACTPVQ